MQRPLLAACLVSALVLAACPALAAALDPIAATDAYLKTVPAAARAKSDAYFEGGYWLILWSALYGVMVSLLLLATGLSARMRDAAVAVTRHRFAAVALYGVMYSLFVAVLTFPLDFYQGFVREHAYSLSNQSFFGWLHDDMIGLLVGTVSSALVLPVIYGVIRAAPRLWWLRGTGVVAGFLVVFALAGPVFLEPLLNDFKPLPPGPIRERILSMARSDGVPAHDVMQFDNSRQTNRVSAHVSGLFGTTQISLNDNLLQQCTPDEILAVLGHEMGHYVMNHIFVFLLCLSAIIAAGFAMAQRLFGIIVQRFGARWRLQGIDDPAGLPVLATKLIPLSLIPGGGDPDSPRGFPTGITSDSILVQRFAGVTMGVMLRVTWADHTGAQLRALSVKCVDSAQVRRMLALAMVLDGRPRGEAASLNGMDRQTLCDWVRRYNASGVEGLKTRKSPGKPPRLTKEQKAELYDLIVKGPDPAVNKVVRWRCVDVQAEVARRWSVDVHESTIGKWLGALGLTRLQPRPVHPKKDPEAETTFKKTSPVWRVRRSAVLGQMSR